jgi:outer membrane protein OmpA-like peptidoglycan-associated protein
MKKALSAAMVFGLAGCVASPPRVVEYPPPPRPAHHVAPSTGQRPETAAARGANVKPLGQGELTAQTVENYMDAQEKELRAALRGSGTTVSRIGDGVAILLPADILFSGDTDALTVKGRNVLTRIALDARKFDSTRIFVSGFTDTKEMPGGNRQKSELRADAVKKALAADGVDLHRIEAKGFGAENPRIPTAANVAEPRNRRIEIDFAPRMKG